MDGSIQPEAGRPPARVKGIPQDFPLEVRSWLMTHRNINTRRAYSSHIRRLIKLGPVDLPLYEYTVDDVVLAAELYDIKDPGPQSWNQCLSAWKNYFEYAMERDLCIGNPARLLRSRAVDEKPMPCPKRNEVRELWRVLNSEKLWAMSSNMQRAVIMRDRAILALLTGCGLRASEICALNVEDFVPDDRTIIVSRKGGKKKAAWWPAAADKYLLPVLHGRRPQDHVFSNSAGRRILPRNINRILARLCTAAKIQVYTAHPFRRFAITEINDKYGIDRAKAFAGHARMSTTMLYDQNRFARNIAGDLCDSEEPTTTPD